MARNQLTARYLDLVAGGGMDADELTETARQGFDLAAASYEGRCLSRPVFLSAAETARLADDLDQLHRALASLPDRLFGGDLAAFARAAGLAGPQVEAVLRSRRAAPTRLARADMYHDGDGFRLMELNQGSAVGGLDTAMLNRTLLAHPGIAEFVTEHRLSYVDTLAAMVDTLRVECGLPADTRPVVAAVDWPESFAQLEAQLRHSAAALAPLGLDVLPCHLGQLRFADGRVWVGGRPVDVLYRIFLLEDLLSPEGPGLIEPVLGAVERGEVALFTPMDAELFGSKAGLAMLSDEAYRDRFEPDLRAALDRLLPWTRLVREEPVTVDGTRVDLLRYALTHREELVLKPTGGHGGTGVVPGWRTDPDSWREQVEAALDRPYVLQRRIQGVPELFPALDGSDQLAPWLLRWGVFTASCGYAGATVVGVPGGQQDVVNMSQGGTAGCCFHQSPVDDRPAVGAPVG